MIHEHDPATGPGDHAPLPSRWYRLLRSMLFQLDPETSHRIVLGLLMTTRWLLAGHAPYRSSVLSQTLWGLTFPNPVGLAAGFDKDARVPFAWPALGFGFAELGTITSRAQPGNPRPRVFRLVEQRALVNRLGFNNAGAVAAARRLSRLPASRHAPLGINIGKSRNVAVEDAAEDYRTSFKLLAPYADYIVINVSSPNTPGLRDLQAREHLNRLLDALQDENSRQATRRPMLVKLSPDLAEDDLVDAVETLERCQVDGVVATNTTLRRDVLHPASEEVGGLSGAPLRQLATETIRRIYSLSRGRLPIIGVGGIFTPQDAHEKIRAGASLLQIYTGMIYQGPTLARQLCHGLEEILRDGRLSHLSAAVGTDSS